MAVDSSHAAAPDNAVGRVGRLLRRAVERRASDVHLEPEATGYAVRYRIDGLLDNHETVAAGTGRAMVNRLMVLAELLTYRQDVPQEGRFAWSPDEGEPSIDLRLSIMPTTHGLRAALRLPGELTQPRTLEALGLPDRVTEALRRFARADAGLLLMTGPAGSGKTTTIYALLEHIVATQPGTSVVSLEDPVERDLAGVTQIEVRPFGELTYERALRSMLRQDPQVLMIGEVRDAATASLVVQAALSGHRMISTLHAGSPAGAIARLLEMSVEPYQINSALSGVVNQRLVRRRAGGKAGGYAGRLPLAEVVPVDAELRKLIASRADAGTMGHMLEGRADHRTLRAAGDEAVRAGLTDRAEVDRVLGASR